MSIKIKHMASSHSYGFSIVELLVTLGVAALAFITISSLYSTAVQLSDKTSDLLIANEIAYQKLQSFENEPFNDIPVVTKDEGGTVTDATQYTEDFAADLPANLPKPHTAQVFITPHNGSSTLKYVFVRVQYGKVSDNQIVEYGSLVQQGGIGR